MSDSSSNADFTLALLGILILLGDWLFAVGFPDWLVWLAWAMLTINVVMVVLVFGLVFLVMMLKERF